MRKRRDVILCKDITQPENDARHHRHQYRAGDAYNDAQHRADYEVQRQTLQSDVQQCVQQCACGCGDECAVTVAHIFAEYYGAVDQLL